jgi:hypothetical protein
MQPLSKKQKSLTRDVSGPSCYSGTLISDLQDTVERIAPLCGHCYNYGEVSEPSPWPSLDYRQVPCPYCPAGEKLAAELDEELNRHGSSLGMFLVSVSIALPFLALLIWDWCKGMVR